MPVVVIHHTEDSVQFQLKLCSGKSRIERSENRSCKTLNSYQIPIYVKYSMTFGGSYKNCKVMPVAFLNEKFFVDAQIELAYFHGFFMDLVSET